MKSIALEIVGLSYSHTQTGAYALVLGECDGDRRLPIIIGGFEAQAIAIELEDMSPSRPLTHDLFKSFAEGFDIAIEEVVIYNLEEGIFFSKVICTLGDKTIEIDARTSDAVALAVRFKCPITTYEFIMEQAGILLDDNTLASVNEDIEPSEENTPLIEPEKSGLEAKSNEELDELLNNAIADEEYEKASQIRDELNSRKRS